MARSVLVLPLIFLLTATFAPAQEPTPTATPKPSPSPVPEGQKDDWRWKKDMDRPQRGDRDGGGPPRPPLPPLDKDGKDGDGPLMRFKKRLEQMSPEDRQHFQENWQRWKQMGANEQKDWQNRAKDDRERMKKVIDDAIQKTGLKLDDDQREVFVLRYRQERRKIEEQLHQEMDAKRESEIADMLQRLKSEFSTPKPTPAPAAATETPAKP